MIESRRRRDPVLRSLLEWACAQDTPPLDKDYVPGTDDRERTLLAALGGLAGAIDTTPVHRGMQVPIEVSKWWSDAPCPPAKLVDDVRQALTSGRDLFGELYTVIVSTTHRRQLGTVFTPPAITSHMLAQCEKHGVEPAIVIDPGAGVGAFTLDASRKWAVPVVAVDLNVATLGLLAARCHLMGHDTSVVMQQDGDSQAEQRSIHLIREDFLAWLPGSLPQTRTPALILGNPPYTRHQELDSNAKETGCKAAGPLVSSRLAGMAAYFLAASLRSLRPEDALCMVLPGSWMHARYGRQLRQHLWELINRTVQLNVFPHDTSVFPQSKVDAMVLFVGPEDEEPQPMTVVEASINGTDVETGQTKHVDRNRECPLTFPRTLQDWKPAGRYHARLGDFFRVHRGIATGRNAFFLLSDTEAALHRIPSSALVPVVSSLRNRQADIIDDEWFTLLGSDNAKRWLLMLSSEEVNTPAIRRYLAQGRRDGVDKGFLAKQRRLWFSVENILPAPLLLLPMTKGAFRVVRNIKGIRHTNNLFGLYPVREDLNIEGAARWLRSHSGQLALREVAQRYGGGMFKLEPRSVGRVQVPRSFGRA